MRFVIFFVLFVLFVSFSLFYWRGNLVKNVKTGRVLKNNEAQSPISISYLRTLNIQGTEIVTEQRLENGTNYRQYIVYYKSEGNKVYGLLTVPETDIPEGGYPAVVFNHGYIPPAEYDTTTRYVSYVDYLASRGFVVFKIDFRGHGRSEGDASGSYFSSAYTIDAITAVKSLQKLMYVNPEKIGMWGHSMSGNVLLRAMEVSSEIRAGVIWAGAVYSYEDFVKYRIQDVSYSHRPYTTQSGKGQANRETSSEIQKIRDQNPSIDFSSDFWRSISLTANLSYLSKPIQIHHAVNDPVVSVGYSRDLAATLQRQKKQYQYFEYEGGGHNINSPYFEKAMQRTVEFLKKELR